MIAVGENGIKNKIVFTDGQKNAYNISKVIEISFDNETDLSNVRSFIYGREANGISTEDTQLFKIHTRTDVSFGTFKGKLEKNARNHGVQQNGRGSGSADEKGTESRVKHSLRENATDSEGRKLSKKQLEVFKDSKVVDENGNLLVVYI